MGEREKDRACARMKINEPLSYNLYVLGSTSCTDEISNSRVVLSVSLLSLFLSHSFNRLLVFLQVGHDTLCVAEKTSQR